MCSSMTNQDLISRWLAAFPELTELEDEQRGELLGATQFSRMREGDIAYRQGQRCHNYVMCIEGQTRVFKTSEFGPRDPALSGRSRGDMRADHLLSHGGEPLPGREHGRNRRAARRAARKRVPSADGHLSALPQIRARQLRRSALEPHHAGRRGGVREPRSQARTATCWRRPTRKASWPRPISNLPSISAACARSSAAISRNGSGWDGSMRRAARSRLRTARRSQAMAAERLLDEPFVR